MSFKLFYLQSFKGLRNTEKVEAEYDNLLKDYQDYLKVEHSEKLKLFLELEREVNSDTFKKLKKETLALTYKGSLEEKKFNEYKKLAGKKCLNDFYQAEKSPELEKYNSLKGNDVISRYETLKGYVAHKYKAEKTAFNDNKKKDPSAKFEDTEAFKKHQEHEKLKSSADIILWLNFPKSATSKAYRKMIDSPVRKHYEELKALVESDTFKERKAYLEDDKKWEKTEAYQKEINYLEMQKDPLFIIYKKYRSSSAFDFFKSWNLVFEDRFDAGKLDTEKWQTIQFAAQKTTGQNFSQLGDLQAYTDGKNVQVKDNHLQLTVRKEKTNTMVWNYSMGFLNKDMEYSAGLLTTGEAFQAKYGILEAKIKYAPNKHLVDLFYLADNFNENRLYLLESGKVNRFGVSVKTGSHHSSISGLQPGQYYIFRVEWSDGKVCWKINNHEIYTTSQNVPNTSMSLNLSTIVIEQLADVPHYFEIDWVRFFQKK